MTIKISFLKKNLQDHYPPGARRAARSIVEWIANNSSKNHNFICLGEKISNSRPLSFFSDELKPWLDSNSLYLPMNSLEKVVYPKLRQVLKKLLPPVIIPILKNILKLPKKIVQNLKQSISALSKKEACNPDAINDMIANEVARQNKMLAIIELDALISFEPFDDIWSLPVENHSVLKIGWFYDAIPKRIHEGEGWRPELFDAATSLMVLRADHIFCDSKSAEEDLQYFFPLSKGKTSVIHLGHDIERFSQRKPCGELNEQLLQLGINPIIPYFLFVGTVEPRKNITGILLAAQKLKQDFPEDAFQIIIAGQIPGQEAIRKMINETNKMVPVFATGYISDEKVANLMHRATGFLFPSLWEGFGIPNLEAMTAETLVITSDLGPMPEVCAEHALYCDPYDHRTIAKKMHQALKMPREERKTRIEDAKLYASKFTWAKAAHEMMTKIEELLAEKQKEPS